MGFPMLSLLMFKKPNQIARPTFNYKENIPKSSEAFADWDEMNLIGPSQMVLSQSALFVIFSLTSCCCDRQEEGKFPYNLNVLKDLHIKPCRKARNK